MVCEASQRGVDGQACERIVGKRIAERINRCAQLLIAHCSLLCLECAA